MQKYQWLEEGSIYIKGKELLKISNIPWIAHPLYSGVFIKDLFTGNESAEHLNAMLVKIEPQHEIGTHIHEGKAELHEIVQGEGMAKIEDQNIKYAPGTISFIPGNVEHSVKAGDEGLLLLAKFTPPLK